MNLQIQFWVSPSLSPPRHPYEHLKCLEDYTKMFSKKLPTSQTIAQQQNWSPIGNSMEEWCFLFDHRAILVESVNKWLQKNVFLIKRYFGLTSVKLVQISSGPENCMKLDMMWTLSSNLHWHSCEAPLCAAWYSRTYSMIWP